MDCHKLEEKLALSLYGEISAEERAEVDAHLAACPACAQAHAELGRLRTLLEHRSLPEPTPDFIVRCRLDLEEALDREAQGWRAVIRSGFGLWPAGSALRVTAALAVLLAGFSLGWAVHRQTAAPAEVASGGTPPWIGSDLTGARISGITRVTPIAQTGQVRITLDAERRFTLEGSLDDPDIQNVLLYAAKSYDNPGIRHDTVEVLRARAGNPVVRDALVYAARHDPNDGVRLEAVQALQELPWGPEVREAVLYVLEHDSNPGVRVAAINILAEHAGEDDLPTLEHLATTDRNPYVRYKCANAVRDARNDF